MTDKLFSVAGSNTGRDQSARRSAGEIFRCMGETGEGQSCQKMSSVSLFRVERPVTQPRPADPDERN
ncbi:MAG: hypothetical protein O7C75_19675 [Verrucomicrobia bacterium]|nr:hypothetical protein [Verrucomicrobiota bacterium]